jgi:DNA polymerase III delta subunit
VGLKNIHLLRGDDAHSIRLRLEALVKSLGTDFDSTMNLTRLDAKTAGLDDIQNAVSTLPFFGSSRMVILDNALAKAEKSYQVKYLAMLESIPPGTTLALLVEDHQKWRKDSGNWTRVWETLTPAHWLIKWFTAHENAAIIDLPLPDDKEMDTWILAEVKRQRGIFETEAARELTVHTGNNTAIASQEIAKLLMYVDGKRPVSRRDVLELVSVEGSADVFTMLDYLMEGRAREAQALMHRLLDDNQPEVILGAVTHRFRQLIMVREVLDSREDVQILAEKKILFGNQVSKYTAAARRYTLQKLEALYHQLLDMDVLAKTTRSDLETGLELFVIQASE